MASSKKTSWYSRFTKIASHLTGRPGAFLIAFGLILVWGISGPLFGFTDTWQLIINTSTTIITFLMVFVIQSTQNRDTEALQVKIDELIRSNRQANSILLDLEEIDEKELERIRKAYLTLAKQARTAKSDN